MKHAKNFDCVQMKNDIQSKLLSERKGMTDKQIQALVEQELESSRTPVAEMWRRIKGKAKHPPTEPAPRS